MCKNMIEVPAACIGRPMDASTLGTVGQKVLMGQKLDPISELVPLLRQLVSSGHIPGTFSSTKGEWLRTTAGCSEALSTFSKTHEDDPRILGLGFVDFNSGQAAGKRRRASEWSGSFGGRVSFKFRDGVPEVGIVDSKFTAKDPENRDGPCDCLVQKVRLMVPAPPPMTPSAIVRVEQIAGTTRATQGKGRASPLTRFHFAEKNPLKRESGRHVVAMLLQAHHAERDLARYCEIHGISLARLKEFERALKESQGIVHQSFSKGDNDDEPEAVQLTGLESLDTDEGSPTRFSCQIVNQLIEHKIIGIVMREEYVLSNDVQLFYVSINSSLASMALGSIGSSDSDNELNKAILSNQAQEETVRQASGLFGSPPTRAWSTQRFVNFLRVCLGEREAVIWDRYSHYLGSSSVEELFLLIDESVQREGGEAQNSARELFISLLDERERCMRGEKNVKTWD